MYKLDVARSIKYRGMSEDSIAKCAAAGIRKIEISANYPDVDFDEAEMKRTTEEWIRICKAYDVEIVSVHLPFGPPWELCTCENAVRERAMKQYLKLISIFKSIGAERFILHPGYPGVPEEERLQRIQNFRRNGTILAQAVKPAKLAVENMPQDCLGNTSDELIELVDGLENVCVCFDTNHWYQETPHDALEKLGRRVETVHINDYNGKVETHWLAGEGVVEWNKIIGFLEQNEYRGPFLYECGYLYTPDQIVETTKRLFEAYNEMNDQKLKQ